MKKILILILLISWFLLGWCNKNTEQVETKNQQEQITKKIDSKKNDSKKASGQTEKKVLDSNINKNSEEEIKKEMKKIENIDKTITSVGWFKIDCKKQFKTKEWQRECEMKQLIEAGYGCTDPKFPKFDRNNLDTYFNKKRFDLLDDKDIYKYEKICQKDIIKIKEQESKNPKKIFNDLKLEDCEKIANEWKIKLPPKKILDKMPEEIKKQILSNPKKYFLKQCRLWSVLNSKKKDCNSLKKYWLDKECEQIKNGFKIISK